MIHVWFVSFKWCPVSYFQTNVCLYLILTHRPLTCNLIRAILTYRALHDVLLPMALIPVNHLHNNKDKPSRSDPTHNALSSFLLPCWILTKTFIRLRDINFRLVGWSNYCGHKNNGLFASPHTCWQSWMSAR